MDHTRELKKIGSMKVTKIPIVFEAFGIISKKLERTLDEMNTEGRIEAFQATGLLKLARILRRVMETGGEKNISSSWYEYYDYN